MRSILGLVAFCLCITAQANDSSFPKITVKGIDPGEMKPGQKIEFYGKNAEVFFQMMPNTLVAANKEENHKLAEKYRYLAIESKSYTLGISCSKMIESNNGEMPNPEGTRCSITFDKLNTDNGDSYEFSPMCSQEKIPGWGYRR